MKHKNSTKRTLALSLLVMLLCVAMLVGTTFAWFTDSASTAVNKIQAGKLDVQLLDERGNSLEGQTLAWQKAAENEDVLWEPGCTYKLQPIVIKNAGNLALKYKIQISGIQGDAKLNEAIEWTITNTSATTALDADHSLAAGASDTLTISGHMKEEAGNEYQNLSIDGIAITVYATQDTVENDSYGNTYDAMAQYPVETISSVETMTNDSGNTIVAKEVVLKSAATVKVSDTETKPLATTTVPVDTKLEDNTTSLKLVITESDEPDGFTVAAGLAATTFDVKVIGVASDNAVEIPVQMYIDKGLSGVKLYHNGAEMTDFTYTAETGLLTFKTATFSPFTVTYRLPAQVSNFSEFLSALEAAESGETIILAADINPTNNFTFNKSVVIDMNGYGFVRAKEASGGYGIKLIPGCDLTMKNGRWDMAGTFGDIAAEGSNGTCNVKYENVVFTNLDNPTKEELAAKPGNASNLVKTAFKANMQGGLTVNATFINCTFNNASVEFSGFNSANTYKAKFEGCTFNNIGNASAINAYAYGMSENCKITVTDCTFNIAVTSNVSVIGERTSTNKIALELTNNTVNGTAADSDYYKVYASTLKFYKDTAFNATESGTTLQGIATMN